MAIVKKQNKFGMINKEGEWVIRPRYKKLWEHNGHGLARGKKLNKYVLLDH